MAAGPMHPSQRDPACVGAGRVPAEADHGQFRGGSAGGGIQPEISWQHIVVGVFFLSSKSAMDGRSFFAYPRLVRERQVFGR